MDAPDATLAEKVAHCLQDDAEFSPELADALRLADMYDAIQPEEFTLPRVDSFHAYRDVETGRLASLACLHR